MNEEALLKKVTKVSKLLKQINLIHFREEGTGIINQEKINDINLPDNKLPT